MGMLLYDFLNEEPTEKCIHYRPTHVHVVAMQCLIERNGKSMKINSKTKHLYFALSLSLYLSLCVCAGDSEEVSEVYGGDH